MRIRFIIVLTIIVTFLLGVATESTSQLSATTSVQKTQQEERRTDPALLGYWRIVVDSSTTHFANIDPWDPEILLFREDGIIGVQVESIKFMEGFYDVISASYIKIKLYHWKAPVMFNYSINNDILTLKSLKGIQVYKHIDANK